MNIGLDMMGGDFAPLEVMKGVSHYLSGENSSARRAAMPDVRREALQQLHAG